MRDEQKEWALARAIAQDVRDQGGCAYFVGGLVRDRLLGRPNKDIDIEVFGLAPSALRALLLRRGQVLEVGAAFGVFRLAHSDLDIAMPRRETCRGVGHRDFDISVDPSLSLKDAARRRDFTMNAMYQDILTEEVLDPWNGRQDLARGALRHVDDLSFAEDALRAFRAAQFAARFELAIEPETLELCRRMRVEHLSRERVFAELAKALLQASKPSVFFR
ncbi:MAG TPA: tRNA nucleotidyltransferase, partial [Clostridia bacterium]|nr:tRNA nucleotidyltransferase [Clostridia bacterium]